MVDARRHAATSTCPGSGRTGGRTIALLAMGALSLAACASSRPGKIIIHANRGAGPGNMAAMSAGQGVTLPAGVLYDLRGPAPRAGHTQTISTRMAGKGGTIRMTLQGRHMNVTTELYRNAQVAVTIDKLEGDAVLQATEVSVLADLRTVMTMPNGEQRVENKEEELKGIRLQSTLTNGHWHTRALDPGASALIQKAIANMPYSNWRGMLPITPKAVGETWESDGVLPMFEALAQGFRAAGATARPEGKQSLTLEAVEQKDGARVARIRHVWTLELSATVPQEANVVEMVLSFAGRGIMYLNLEDYSYTLDTEGAMDMSMTVMSGFGGETVLHARTQTPLHIVVDCHAETDAERNARLALRD